MGEEYKSFSSSVCSLLHSLVTSSLLGPNILLNTMFSNTLSSLSSRNINDQVSHRYKTTGKIIVLYSLSFKFLDSSIVCVYCFNFSRFLIPLFSILCILLEPNWSRERRPSLHAVIKLRDLQFFKYSVSVFVQSVCISPALQTHVHDGLPEPNETLGVLYRDECLSPQGSLGKLSDVSTRKFTACTMCQLVLFPLLITSGFPSVRRLQPNDDMASVAAWSSMKEGWLGGFCLF